MKKVSLLLLVGWCFSCFGQDGTDTTYVRLKDTMDFVVKWQELAKGVSFCETDAPLRSIKGDSKLTILKINPAYVDMHLATTTAMDSVSRPVNFWADTLNFDIVFNAGMYDLARPLISRGLLKNGDHSNQRVLKEGWNTVLALNPVDSKNQIAAKIYDLQCNSFDQFSKKYNGLIQGIRMLDCEGNPMSWKKNQYCSMLVCAQDKEDNLYLIFTRSPYSHNQMIRFMKQFPTPLHSAIYMEGGPETSLYVHIGDFCMQKVGSYVSGTYPKDSNSVFWGLPNVVGIKVKK
jgi:hypothetical protein